MKKIFAAYSIPAAVLAVLCDGCSTQQPQSPVVYNRVPASSGETRSLTLTPQAIPGTVKALNHKPTGGYAPTNVQAQLKIDVKDGTKQVRVIRDNSDPFVIIPDQSPLGDTVTAIATRALMGCEFITAIQIPETVEWIGELAFANCPNLLYVAVSKYNPCFKDVDGVLYTAEEDRLLLYPPMHTGNTFYLPATVSEIADMAFYQCAYLSTVRYEGTAEQWHMIQIGAKNYSLTAASVIFSVRNGA